ncbi:helix-turn-helix domain-containing protein [Fusobacterium sp. MFO224]|uniref:helix-turn-helix domain-containing protein n=1 Tax=Fusobacterium sp. MFO224 TaxID=3378070 RepID=UPI003852218C
MEYSYKFLPFLKVFKETKLKMSEKIIYFIIESLDNDNGCFASNAYFTDLTGYSRRTCINSITELRKLGYIKVKCIRDPKNYKNTIKRIIHVKKRYIFLKDRKEQEITEHEKRIADKILFYYEMLGLPKYDEATNNYNIVIKACDKLGEEKVEEALSKMSKSTFVKEKLSINSIFKIENLEKGLNGYFKDFDKKENGYEDNRFDPWDI